MSVVKTTRECYEVRANGEWANISLGRWDRPTRGDAADAYYYGGELAIRSSFGTWGYTWTACAVPFKRFLTGIDFEYAFLKLMGDRLNLFDGTATLKQIQRDIIYRRRHDELSAGEARDVWDAVLWEAERIESGDQSAFGYAMWDVAATIGRHPMADYFNDPAGWPTRTRHNPQAVGFWRDLWPEFVSALIEEELPSS